MLNVHNTLIVFISRTRAVKPTLLEAHTFSGSQKNTTLQSVNPWTFGLSAQSSLIKSPNQGSWFSRSIYIKGNLPDAALYRPLLINEWVVGGGWVPPPAATSCIVNRPAGD